MPKNTIVLSGKDEELETIKQFCQEEGLYLGKFVVRCAIRHIEEVKSERQRKAVNKILEGNDGT